MNAVTIEVSVTGMEEAAADLQAFRSALANRKPLHTAMAKSAAAFTREFLGKDARHSTAERLGATPSGFRAKAGKGVQEESDETQAMVLIPRRTGLGRAFGDVTLRPGSGRTYLTISAHAETYGKSVRDFAEDAFKFVMLGIYRALIWAETSGRHVKGEIAYWLKREVFQKQDRSLLPSDAAYQAVGRGAAITYLTHLSQAS